MRTSVRSIIGFAASSAFLLAGFLNSQLTWNAAAFTAPQQEVVTYNGHDYSINKDYNGHLIQIYTDKKTSEFYVHTHGAAVRALSSFFGSVK